MMNIANSVLWLLPLVLVGAGFLLSGVKKFRFGRLGGMVAVFLAAFLQDLQATSFRNDTLDSIFSLFVLMVFTDLFWRIIRLKTKIVRVVGLLTGIILFTVFYGDWISGGPKNIFTKHSAKIISEYKNGKQAYFIKRRPAPQDTVTGFEYVLFKERGFSFFEQYCNRYSLPDGYEKALISFEWNIRGNITEVSIVGDSDTLWLLDSDITPK